MIRFKITVCTALLLAVLIVFMPACSSGGSSGGGDTTNGVPLTIANLPVAPNASDENGKQGIWRENISTSTITQGSYVNGNKEGDWGVYQTTGQMSHIRTEPYKNGLKHGTERVYRPLPNRELLQIIEYVNGKRHGIDKRYFLSIQLTNVQTIPPSAREGDRVIRWRYTYKNGLLHSDHSRNSHFDDFILLGSQHIRILNERIEYENGLKSGGAYRIYFRSHNSGRIIDVRHLGSYKAGKRHDERWSSDETVISSGGGQSILVAIGEFHEGNRIGTWTVENRTYDCGEADDLAHGNNPGPFPAQIANSRPIPGDLSGSISGAAGILRITDFNIEVTTSFDPRCMLVTSP